MDPRNQKTGIGWREKSRRRDQHSVPARKFAGAIRFRASQLHFGEFHAIVFRNCGGARALSRRRGLCVIHKQGGSFEALIKDQRERNSAVDATA
jgi:hypothetical protein